MARSIQLTGKEWSRLRKRIKEEYPTKPSLFLIRESMRRELGFTTRYHKTYSPLSGTTEFIWLDFFDDNLETLFRLKYL